MAGLVVLFLPWFDISFAGVVSIPGTSVDALSAHGWMWLDLLAMVAIIGYLVALAGAVLPTLPASPWQALLGATGFVALLTLIGFISTPAGYGHAIGAYLGIVAALTAVAGGVLMRSDIERPAGAAMAGPVPVTAQRPSTWPSAPASPTADPTTPAHNPALQHTRVAARTPTAAASDVEQPTGRAATPAHLRCAQCGHDSPPASRFCESCGAALAAAHADPAS